MDSVFNLLREVSGPAYYSTMVLGTLVGSLAVISPRLFGKICEKGSYWVTTPLQSSALDKKVFDTDRYMLKHCRLTGALILTMVVVFAATMANAG
jgi:hypothetical protein